jgi:hypothetical protein
MGEQLGERKWVRALAPQLCAALCPVGDIQVTVSDGVKLPYTSQIYGYSKDGKSEPQSSHYETDLLISDTAPDGGWIPRVVIECKLGKLTTHDALTYSTKAETHKHVHPYLRYGFLAGGLANLPVRLVKHGAYFDFMAAWPAAEPSDQHWAQFVTVVAEEVVASRTLQSLLLNNRIESRQRFHLLRRPLVLLS